MGANRALRRKQERETIRGWKEKNRYDQVLALQRNGIRQSDLDKAYNDGYEKGYLYASEAFLRKMYAAIAKELIEAKNSNEDVFSFIRGVDHRFAVMFDADEEIEEVYRQTGIHLNVDKNEIERIERGAE
jgi:hypothetical protein